jgi:hypothetical protein
MLTYQYLCIAGVAAAFLCTGCLTTTVWREASGTAIGCDSIAGVDINPDKSRWLVVNYWSSAEWATLRVPLAADGAPAAPFGFARPGLLPFKVMDAVSPVQSAAVLARAGPVGLRCGPYGNARVPAITPRYEQTPADVNTDLRAIAYRLDAGNRVTVPRLGQDQPIPADLHILLVPQDRPRPPGARHASRLEAALLTPVTIAFDAVGTPLIALFVADAYVNHWITGQ